MRRCTRLYRPVFYYLAFWSVALVALHLVLPEHVYEPVAGISIQLLWFLGAYVLVLAAVPLLARISTTGRLAATVVGAYAAVAVVDAVRINVDVVGAGISQHGRVADSGHARGGLSPQTAHRRAALAVGAAMLALNLALLCSGPTS